MKTYTVGRGKKADIILADADDSVSKYHIELVQDHDNNFYLTDCGSLNGTFLWKNGQWIKIKQTYINDNNTIRLGTHYKIKVEKLLNLINNKIFIDDTENSIIRNPETGEVLKRG